MRFEIRRVGQRQEERTPSSEHRGRALRRGEGEEGSSCARAGPHESQQPSADGRHA